MRQLAISEALFYYRTGAAMGQVAESSTIRSCVGRFSQRRWLKAAVPDWTLV
jgi:hypothetical protein